MTLRDMDESTPHNFMSEAELKKHEALLRKQALAKKVKDVERLGRNVGKAAIKAGKLVWDGLYWIGNDPQKKPKRKFKRRA